jgi:hypothetical protein
MADQTESPPQSPLEQALIAMDQRRLSPSEFYQRLLATEVLVPTVLQEEQGEAEEEYVTEAPENFSLIIMDVDGDMVVPMFDDFDRLQRWASESGSDVGYIGIGADALLSMLDPDLSIAFFAGEEGFYLFDPATLENLKDPEVELLDETPANMSDDPIMINAPETVPDGLVDALTTVLQSQDGDVLEARLLMLSGSPTAEESEAQLTIALTLGENSDALFNELARKLTKAASSVLDADEMLQFLNLTGTELGDSLADSLPPFFAWPGQTIH